MCCTGMCRMVAGSTYSLSTKGRLVKVGLKLLQLQQQQQQQPLQVPIKPVCVPPMPFVKPNTQKKPTPYLFLSNCGPRWGVTPDVVRELLRPFCSDPSQVVLEAPDSQSHYWVVTFPGPQGPQEAAAVVKALSNQPFEPAGGRTLVCKFAKWVPEPGAPQEDPQPLHPPVACTTEEANIPGLYLVHDFITEQEEQQLLSAIDQQPWLQLSKRRVQHYGYRFEYTTRGVDLKEKAGAIPDWQQQVVQRVQELPDVPAIDQVTVNEYTPGVGIAPHVDAHSSFTGSILSLSLLGSCCMVFRKAYVATGHGAAHVISSQGSDDGCGDQPWEEQWKGQDREVVVFLPPRSLLMMSGEARYAWQHYIPHRKSDWVNGQQVPRDHRRVSLTLRKVRGYACDCAYPKYCDSQEGVLPPPASYQQQEDAEQQEQHMDAQQQQGMHEQQPGLQGQHMDAQQQQGMQEQRQGMQEQQHSALEQPQQVQQEQQQGAEQQEQHMEAQQQQRMQEQQMEVHQQQDSASDLPQQLQQEQQQQDQQGQQQPEVQQLRAAATLAANGIGACKEDQGNGHHELAVAPDAAPADGAAGAAADVQLAATGSQSCQALEDTHVHQVYDVIAGHFSSTRFAVWPKVRAFLESLSPGSVVADVGCGNGKYLGVRPDLAVLGCDRSAGLAAVAAQRLAAGGKASGTGIGLASAAAADVFVCDALQLCYRHCSCDAVLCIAVLHHMSSRQRRLALLQQLAAVLRCGGRGIVTVWATEQEDPAKTIQRWHRIQPAAQQESQQQVEQHSQQQEPVGTAAAGQQQASEGVDGQADKQQQQAGGVVEGPDYFVPWHLPFHKAGGLAAAAQKQAAAAAGNGDASSSTGSSGGKAGASKGPSKVAVDTAKGAVVFQRFYHLFEKGELETLIAEVPGLRVEQVFYDRSNWCVEFAKQA